MTLTLFLPLTPRKNFAGVDRSGRGFNPRPALTFNPRPALMALTALTTGAGPALTIRAESFFSPSLAL